MFRLPNVFALMPGLAAALLGLTAAAAPSEDLQALYQQAKQQGETQIVLYTPTSHLKPVWQAFGKQFAGIEVVDAVIPGGGAPLLARIRAEGASGNHAGDLVLSGLGDINTLISENRIVPYIPPQAATLPAEDKDPAGLYDIPYKTLYTFVYNTARVKTSELPTTLDEAIGPNWAGKFAIGKYTGAASVDLAGAVLAYNHAISDEQLRLLKQNGQTAPTVATLLNNIAQGRVAFGLFVASQYVKQMQEDGAPIGISFMPDSAVLIGLGFSVLKGAPHPAAARLLKGWLLSPDGQRALTGLAASYATQPGYAAPAGFPDVGAYRFKEVPLAQYEQNLKAFNARTNAIFNAP